MRRTLAVASLLALAACSGGSSIPGLGGGPSGSVQVANGAGQPLSTSASSPYRTNGDALTVTESGYSGSFTATDLAQRPCYTVQAQGSSVFTITEGGLLCDSSTVDPIKFSDSSGHSTTQYFAPPL